MNYAEALGYWYLRLNGFFPLGNFVLHDYNELLHRADCDLLAVRMPHVEEAVGGQPVDWDNQAFNTWGLDRQRQIIGAVVEVKGGENAESPGDAFTPERLRQAVFRLGFFSGAGRDRALEVLAERPTFVHDNFAIVKLFVTSNPRQNRQPPPWFQVSLEHVDEFIRNRFSRYRPQKNRARSFFPSELIQYLIWQSEAENPGG
jgi:hypothetical protein